KTWGLARSSDHSPGCNLGLAQSQDLHLTTEAIMRRLCITYRKWGKSSGEHPIAVRSASVKNASCRNAEETGTASSGYDFALTRLAFVTAKCPRYIRSAGLAPRH